MIQPGDALSFVVDVRAVVPPSDPADEPTVEEFPLSDELVTEPVTEDLVTGDGATLEAGGTGVFQLIAARGDNGEVIESTWTTGEPQALVIEEGQLLDGLVEGLAGMKVGGRRAITIPYDPNMGLTPETNVVDHRRPARHVLIGIWAGIVRNPRRIPPRDESGSGGAVGAWRDRRPRT